MVVTRDLQPGGRAIAVTHENKIAYVHLRAYDRLYTQIADAAKAFAQAWRRKRRR